MFAFLNLKDMIIRFLFLFLIFSGSVFAQTQQQTRKYYGDKESEYVEGSPYLFDDFRTATILDKSGQLFNDFKVKYNLFTQEAIFMNKEGVVEKFGNPLSEIRIKNLGTFKNGYANPMYGTSNTLYEVLFKDKLELLKLNVKKIEDGPLGYNDAHPPKKYVSETKYYLIINNKWVEVTKSKKSLIKAFNDKETLINEYISKNNLNISNQNDLISLITYCNTLL